MPLRANVDRWRLNIKLRAFRLALALMAVSGQTVPATKAAGEVYDRTAATAAICRGYAAAQHALPYDTMYAQCMYARGYIVPGFSPSPDSPGYQGELPGPGRSAVGTSVPASSRDCLPLACIETLAARSA